MNLVLKLKHWQLFLILLTSMIISNFTWIGEDLFNTVIGTIGLLIYFGWHLLLGIELSKHSRHGLFTGLFIFNGAYIAISMTILSVFFGGEYSADSLAGGLWIIYMMFALLQFMFFSAKALKSTEQQYEPRFKQYFGTFLLLLFWPIGVWFFQPRINRVVAGR